MATFPLPLADLLGHWGSHMIYAVIGVAFGMTLESAGFGNSQLLAAQFYFKDMRVFKVMFTAILVANNVRDIDTDRDAGKRTLAVIIGRDRARFLFDALVWGAFLLVGLFALSGWTPAWTLLALATIPLAIPLTITIHREIAGPPLITVLKGVARLDLAFGLLVALGAALPT